MATHTELVHDPESPKGFRFCLDRVVRDDDDGRVEYAFVWRGTARSTEGFQPRPAYFDWASIGRTLRLAFSKGGISREEFEAFQRALMGL